MCVSETIKETSSFAAFDPSSDVGNKAAATTTSCYLACCRAMLASWDVVSFCQRLICYVTSKCLHVCFVSLTGLMWLYCIIYWLLVFSLHCVVQFRKRFQQTSNFETRSCGACIMFVSNLICIVPQINNTTYCNIGTTLRDIIIFHVAL